MSFSVSRSAYDRFMGRYSERLAPKQADFAGVHGRVLDVGCGPGALTAVLVERLGADCVSGVDPSESFVAAARERHPGVDVRLASAEELPFEDGTFDVAIAQLVVHFMTDPVAGLAEMGRVVRSGGTVSACVWDHAGGMGMLTPLWTAARELDPAANDESELAGSREGQLVELFRAAGLSSVEDTTLEVEAGYAGFDDWWEPFTFGVGPAGAYVARLDDAGRTALREACRAHLPDGPFSLAARAWAARGTA